MIWYDIWYDMIWYDNAICHGIWYEIWYEIWCDMRSYGVAYEWYGMVCCYIGPYTVGKNGKLAVIPLILPFLHTVCVTSGVLLLCVCASVGGWVGGCGVSKTVHGHLGSFNLCKCYHRGDVWIIPDLIRGNMLHVEHISCVITDCDQQQWVIPFPLSISHYVLLE